ncbi:hypothetical protein NE664_10945 [Anaerotignum faecicola]|nr:hypothetical protein [Anaerotignum faecicola]
MKFKKTLGILAVSAIMAFSAFGCTGSDTSAAGGNAEGMTAEDRVKAANEKMAEVTSMDSNMKMEMDMSAGEQAVSTVTDMDITYFMDPLKMKINMTMDMGELGSQSMEMYADVVDDVYTMYVNDGTQWLSQEIPAEALGAYDTKEAMMSYLGDPSAYTEVGTEDIDGVSAVKLEGKLSGDELKEAVESSGSLDSLSSLGLDSATISGLYEDLGEVPIYVWLDAETNYPVKYEMDMTAVMQKLMDNIMAAAPEAANAEASISFTKFKMSMTCSNFNEATDFEIPAEAK